MKKISDLSVGEREKIEKYALESSVFEDAKDDFLGEHFVSLQLGVPLVIGERLNALSGQMKDFVFGELVKHVFIKNLGIPKRRFARQTLCAQICINSFGRKRAATFKRTRWEDLRDFFHEYAHPHGIDSELFE